MSLTSDELVAIHAEQRAKERYGIDLSDADRADMVSQVKDGRGLFFKKKTGSAKVSIWLVWWAGASRIVPIYYKSGRVLTVLPTDAFYGPPQSPMTAYRNSNWKTDDAELESALDAFWNVAYTQGHEQRGHDDEEGTAQKAEDELRRVIASKAAVIAAKPSPARHQGGSE